MKTCPYSSSCFNCPLKDCGIKQNDAPRVNVLPTELMPDERGKRRNTKKLVASIEGD